MKQRNIFLAMAVLLGATLVRVAVMIALVAGLGAFVASKLADATGWPDAVLTARSHLMTVAQAFDHPGRIGGGSFVEIRSVLDRPAGLSPMPVRSAGMAPGPLIIVVDR